MSEGMVTFLLTKLGNFLLERGKQLETVKNEAEHVSDEIAFNMKAFLRLADAMEESDSALKLLVKKVRDVAYDTEDALDELIRLCLANDNGHGVISCFRKIFLSVKDARARRRVASKIQGIKSRVISISESHRRYCNKNNIMVHGSSSNSINYDGMSKGCPSTWRSCSKSKKQSDWAASWDQIWTWSGFSGGHGRIGEYDLG